MSRLRVLMVSWEYPPVMYGGLGRHVHALSRSLVSAGHDVVVLSQAPAGTPETEPGSDRDPSVARAVLPADAPDVYQQTEQFVRELQDRLVQAHSRLLTGWRPDVVHGHDWVVAEATERVAEATGAPVVATVHATEHGLWNGHLTSPFSRWRDGIERDLVATARRTIVCSTSMQDEVVTALDADPTRVAVVPNGVDADRWVSTDAQRQEARSRLGLTDEPLVVLVGRLEWEKGGQDAINALDRLTGRGLHPHLALVGDGARRADLARQARKQGLAGRVHLVGRLDDDAAASLVGAAEVALVPSRYEPFGLVALEAMAAGTPVVVSDAGGLPDIVHNGVTGVVVPPADPDGLAEAIADLLSDADLRRSMGAQARRRATEVFSWGRVAAQTAAVYSDALA